MEGKIWGISLSVLGIAGLIGALIYVNGPKVNTDLPVLVAAGVCGTLAFFIGIWLIDHKRSGRQLRQPEGRPGQPVASRKEAASQGGVSSAAGTGTSVREHSTIPA